MSKWGKRAESDESQAITVEEAQTLGGLFRERVRRTPNLTAYRYHDPGTESWRDLSWSDMAHYVARWQAALRAEQLEAGDRVAIMLRNSPEWVAADQAALGLGLVVVPLFVDDNAGNMAYMLGHSGARVLFLRDLDAWHPLADHDQELTALQRVVTVHSEADSPDERVTSLERWLPDDASQLHALDRDPEALATIIYTSGTTGKPKGVMLSHYNILWNARANWEATPPHFGDVGLSFLPLAHVYERTAGYYLGILAGVTGAFNRSVDKLLEDIQIIQPHGMLSVPRIFERMYSRITDQLGNQSRLARALFNATVNVGYSRFERIQGRDRWRLKHLAWPLLDRLVARKLRHRLFGRRLRFTVSGGAALSPEVARTFIGLGVDLRQGYGLTEASPTVSSNRERDNDPESVGIRLPDVQVKMQQNGELLVKSPGVMMGYWRDPDATAQAIDDLGWLHTGDRASRIENNRIYLSGRFKEIIVMANGEKTPPAAMEQAITLDPVIEQAMVVGEGRPYMAALVVLDPEQRDGYLRQLGLDPEDPAAEHGEIVEADLLQRMAHWLDDFPHYAQVRRVSVVREQWTVQNGMLTPTMKIKRRRVLEAHQQELEELYAGHAQVARSDISRNTRVAG